MLFRTNHKLKLYITEKKKLILPAAPSTTVLSSFYRITKTHQQFQYQLIYNYHGSHYHCHCNLLISQHYHGAIIMEQSLNTQPRNLFDDRQTKSTERREIAVLEESLGTDVRSPNPPVADLLFELTQNVSSLVVVGDEKSLPAWG